MVLSRPQNLEYNFKKALTWSKITSGIFSARYCGGHYLFDDAAAICHNENTNILYFVLGLLNSPISQFILNILNPTINIQISDIAKLPVILPEENTQFSTFSFQLSTVNSLVEKNISLSKSDWDSFETSWDFTKHPLLPTVDFKDAAANSIRISDMYSKWEGECSERFAILKSNEEELNRIFIENLWLAGRTYSRSFG